MRMMSRMCGVVAAWLLVALSPAPLGAEPIAVDSQYLQGYASTPDTSGVVATDGWTDANGGFRISWDVSYDGSVWNYAYAITDDPTGQLNPELSHVIIEISPSVTSLDGVIFDANFAQAELALYEPGQPSNPNLPGDLYGFKVDGHHVLTFSSTQAPVWGDFYAKDGRPQGDVWATAWNTGFGSDAVSGDDPFSGWIPTPDTTGGNGGDPIPEPATMALLSLGGISVLGVRRLRRRRS